jgi:hypothetical protein
VVHPRHHPGPLYECFCFRSNYFEVTSLILKAMSPFIANKAEVIKEISHLVGDPLDVDEKRLKSEGVVRVRVLCKDATKLMAIL